MSETKQGMSLRPGSGTEAPELAAFGAAGFQRWLDASRASASGFAAAQAEVAEFWRDRLERWREAAGCLAACREPEEALRVQADYAREMMRAYAAFWPRLVGALVEAAPEGAGGEGKQDAPAQAREEGPSGAKARKFPPAA